MAPMKVWTVVESPIGPLRVVGGGEGVTAIEFSPFDEEAQVGERNDEAPLLVEAARQLRAYFAGELTDFDLPLAPRGTDYQHRVWAALREVPYGRTATYAEIAAALGQPRGASRAVGSANGRNPIPVVVPCHRIVGADGSLTGYAGGLERKQVLLDLERSEEDLLF
ncbi:methylated-DNA--[protein]-cysteine S-methyltransferase [Nocardioides malaquae]|nr:methylated-DNA--[protein]-cysteine S-methyltransferase [Nocardioides malaquae]